MPRIFIAIPVPNRLQNALGALASSADPGLRWVAPHHLHLTLRFLGEIGEADVARADAAVARTAAAHPKPFTLIVKGLGAFPTPRSARVIWCGLSGDVEALQRWQRDLEGALREFGFPAEDRPFRPHITLARMRSPGRWPERLTPYEEHTFGEWRVDRVQVIESRLSPRGPAYTVRSERLLEG